MISQQHTECMCCHCCGRPRDDASTFAKIVQHLPQHEWQVMWSSNAHELPDTTGSKQISDFATLRRVFAFLPFDLYTVLAVASTCRSWRIMSDRLPHWRYLLPLKTEALSAVLALRWDQESPWTKVWYEQPQQSQSQNEHLHYKLVPATENNLNKSKCKKSRSIDGNPIPNEQKKDEEVEIDILTKSSFLSDIAPCSFPQPENKRNRLRCIWKRDGCLRGVHNKMKKFFDCDSDQDEEEFAVKEKAALQRFIDSYSTPSTVDAMTRNAEFEEDDYQLFFNHPRRTRLLAAKRRREEERTSLNGNSSIQELESKNKNFTFAQTSSTEMIPRNGKLDDDTNNQDQDDDDDDDDDESGKDKGGMFHRPSLLSNSGVDWHERLRTFSSDGVDENGGVRPPLQDGDTTKKKENNKNDDDDDDAETSFSNDEVLRKQMIGTALAPTYYLVRAFNVLYSEDDPRRRNRIDQIEPRDVASSSTTTAYQQVRQNRLMSQFNRMPPMYDTNASITRDAAADEWYQDDEFPIRVRRFTVQRHRSMFVDRLDPTLRFFWTYPSLSTFLDHVRQLIVAKNEQAIVRPSVHYRPSQIILAIALVFFFAIFGLCFLPFAPSLNSTLTATSSNVFDLEVHVMIFYASILMVSAATLFVYLIIVVSPRRADSKWEIRVDTYIRPKIWNRENMTKLMRRKAVAFLIFILSAMALCVPMALLAGRIATARDFLSGGASGSMIVSIRDLVVVNQSVLDENYPSGFPYSLTNNNTNQLPNNLLPFLEHSKPSTFFASFPTGTKLLYHPRQILNSNVVSYSRSMNSSLIEKNKILNFSVNSENAGYNQTSSLAFVSREVGSGTNNFGYYTVMIPSASSTSGYDNVTIVILSNSPSCPFWSSRPSLNMDTSKITSISDLEKMISYNANSNNNQNNISAQYDLLHPRFKSTFVPLKTSTQLDNNNNNSEIISNASSIFPQFGEALQVFQNLFSNTSYANKMIFNRSTTNTGGGSSFLVGFGDTSATKNVNFLLPCQQVQNSMVTIQENKSLLLRLATKFTPHWSSFYAKTRDPKHEQNWEKVSLDFKLNGMVAFAADDEVFYSHNGALTPNVPDSIPDEKLFENQDFINPKLQNDENLIANYWSAAHPAGIRRMKKDYETGIVVIAVIVVAFVAFVSYCGLFAVGASRVMFTITSKFFAAVFIYPLVLVLYLAIACDRSASYSDADELANPVNCLIVSKYDLDFPIIYSVIFIMSIIIPTVGLILQAGVVPLVQLCTRRMTVCCKNFSDCCCNLACVKTCKSCCSKCARKVCCCCFEDEKKHQAQKARMADARRRNPVPNILVIARRINDKNNNNNNPDGNDDD